MKLKPSMIGWALVATGLLLALPSSAYLMEDPTDDNRQVAFTPALRIPLDSLNASRSASVAFTVPFRWRDMRSNWGDPVYLASARLRDRGLPNPSFEQLGLSITVVRDGHALDVKSPPYAPYGHDSDTEKLGFVFSPNPGDELLVNVSVLSNSALPLGELIVGPFADSRTKDRIVGGMIDKELRPWAKRLLASGLILTTIGAVLAFTTRHSSAV